MQLKVASHLALMAFQQKSISTGEKQCSISWRICSPTVSRKRLYCRTSKMQSLSLCIFGSVGIWRRFCLADTGTDFSVNTLPSRGDHGWSWPVRDHCNPLCSILLYLLRHSGCTERWNSLQFYSRPGKKLKASNATASGSARYATDFWTLTLYCACEEVYLGLEIKYFESLHEQLWVNLPLSIEVNSSGFFICFNTFYIWYISSWHPNVPVCNKFQMIFVTELHREE